MMTQAFYTGLSGLKSNQTTIDTLSDNLANISTIGFRGYNTEYKSLFEDYLNTAVTHENSTGVGVQVSSTSMNNSMGNIMSSDRNTDLAILGDGWFGISNSDDEILYTRAGNFTFNRNSDLVTTDGYHVLGTMGNNISSDGILTSISSRVDLTDITQQRALTFPTSLTCPPIPTTNSSFSGNIGLGTNNEPVVISSTVTDSNSHRNQLKLVFRKSTTQPSNGIKWDVVATVKSSDGRTTYDTQRGSITFDTHGALVSNTLRSIDNNGTTISIDLGSGSSGITSSGARTSSSSESDGRIGGELTGYAINQNAEVIATFSNGVQSSVGKIALYHFENDQGLERISGTRFAESSNSGRAIFYKDANGKNVNGTNVLNSHLENSNVKIDVGLTDLIIYQRSYDANAKSVTTADEMMQKALQMDA